MSLLILLVGAIGLVIGLITLYAEMILVWLDSVI